ncbi:MAG: hypothetical protein AN488_17530, partial [Anabaena sp. WA113]
MINPYYIASSDWLNTGLRLCFALFIGALIGLERQLKNKPAGLRTHMLVSLGSCMFVLITIQTGGIELSPDSLSRVVQGITA